MKVAITGKLENMERKEAADLINTRTNAEWVKSVTYETNYLVATLFDSGKAKKAAKIGVAVISEQEMLQFIEEGHFPEIDTPEMQERVWAGGGDNLNWVDVPENEQKLVILDYVDADGVITEERLVQIVKKAVAPNGKEYIGGMFGSAFRTFRQDGVSAYEARISSRI